MDGVEGSKIGGEDSRLCGIDKGRETKTVLEEGGSGEEGVSWEVL
jgi:hypothetical protein